MGLHGLRWAGLDGRTWGLHGAYMGLHGLTWGLHGLTWGLHGAYMGKKTELSYEKKVPWLVT